MSHQPPTSPLEVGSSSARPKKKRGCLRILAWVIGGLFLLGLIGSILDPVEEEPEPAPTVTVTVTPSVEPTTASPSPSPSRTPSPEPTTAAPPPPAPEPEPEVVEPPRQAPEPVAPPAPVVPDPPAPPAVAPYPNCDAVRADGAAPIFPGDPGWNPGLDRDKDGQACGDDG